MSYDTLIDKVKFEDGFLKVCNAIRAKTGTHDGISFPGGMVNAINSIPTGGNSDNEMIVTNPPSIPKFKKNTGYVQLWGWGAGNDSQGFESLYLFQGNEYSEYIGGETTHLELSINSDGSVNGIPKLNRGKLLIVRTDKQVIA